MVVFSNYRKLKKEFGANMAKKIMQRLDDMAAADNLQVLMTLPGRHHQLTGDREGQFACDLVHPYRLIYEPGDDPLPADKEGNLILEKVTKIIILGVEDYH